MKRWLLFIAALLALAGGLSACKRNNPETTAAQPPLQLTPANPPQPPPVLVRIHFAGAEEIAKDTNSLAFTNEFASAEARILEKQTLDKLSRAPGTWFKDKISHGAGDGSAELRPLLDDLVQSEWIFEMRGATDCPDYALAIRLDDARAQLWETNLSKLLEAWTKINVQDITNGWRLKKDLPPNLVRLVRAGDWVIIGCGQNELPLSDEWIKTGVPAENETSWLSMTADWPKLPQFFPALAKFDFPAASLRMIGKGGNFLWDGKFELSEPLPPLDAWQVPTNVIHQPLISFTAARGFSSWLEEQSWAWPLKLSPAPSQLFCWAIGVGPLATYLAFPVPNATNALAQVDQNLIANTNWQKHLFVSLQKTVATNRLSWQGFPFINPEIRALHEPYGDFLLADVFPIPPLGKMAPVELYQTFNHNNMVYYHWEITSSRLKTFPELAQFALLLSKHRQFDLNSVAGRWLNRIGPTLGNNVTEVIQTGPTELTFTRSAPGGLTAVELIALANWLEAPNFPGCDLSMPPRPRPPHRPAKTLSATTPSPVPAPAAVPAPPTPAPHH
jgi:hypothetical protein